MTHLDTNQQDPSGLPMLTAARLVQDSDSLEGLSRPFLDLLHAVTGLDSTYLSEIRWNENTQHILFANNQGDLDVPEGLEVDWGDTICRLALERGPQYTDDVPTVFPDSEAGRVLGLQTYISVPVVDHEQEVLGTLCGASGRKVSLTQDTIDVMTMFARLISDQWERDISRTELTERAERAEAQVRERATYLAEAEHKLKSPLTVIKGWSNFLDDAWADLPESQKHEGVTMISKSAEQLAAQLEDLLREARTTALSTELRIRRCDITEVLERVQVELRALSDIHDIRVESSEAVTALADQKALWQVMVHLVENAIKYSPNGGVIRIITMTSPDHVKIMVSDEGLGIPTDVDIFEPFMRSDRADLARIGGTGVGLHIVATLMRAMNGRVSARRNEGPGSTFVLELPTKRSR